ncbi:helix-turn-helix transcriptional regulator [Microbacterium sp. C7(2022)]|uniref:helix-turn-helix domain-containing protein n=1 Tax=Microbacterium sp. C7(2022) TaxID=2992759 RepID=UPI00237A9812|nr:helix-turn-helix transcriptional regulator [Microbacterium sp. C7(2022)]MDE0546263.1 helix-turn-helix transcriptional regulator [Microbacterium sp. C7(2022)]
MPTSQEPSESELVPPAESSMLRDAYKKSGLTVADLASATGLSVGTVNIALSGIRYRDGRAKVAVPADRTLVKLASVLRIHPEVLRAHDRQRASELLAEASEASAVSPIPSDLNAQAVVTGRSALARQVLALFAAEELRAELERRDRAEHESIDREAWDDVADTLRTDQWPG